MTADEERTIAREIIAAEQAAEKAIQDIPGACAALAQNASQKERTRARALERLEEAVTLCEELCQDRPELRGVAMTARRELHKADQLRWSLAMSAQHVSRSEARKLACALMDVEDLRQHGYIGLLSAARRFDPERGIRFSTYARWWVRAHMTRALENTGRTVRLPGGAVEQLRNLRKVRARYEQMGARVDVEDLAAEVGMDVRRARMLLSQGGVVSMEQENANGARVEDYLEAEGIEHEPDARIILSQDLGNMRHAFEKILDQREKYILTHHYGLGNVESRSMSSIGESIGISRERVRQIEVSALKRLRALI
ncbi:MAG: sigma-70 family RNA polymerase sigma factor [Myxococcota bacterium]